MMELSKLILIVILSLLLAGCGELFYCKNPSNVSLVEWLPCSNCEYRGTVQPNLCPDGTYSHKLQCAAAQQGANVVLLKRIGKDAMNPSFPIYRCPRSHVPVAIKNDKTDVSNNCCAVVN
ncbi:hypothetical protein [Aquicella lusitana]|uniref:Uncharacterized protein n=1 Tax=Aquicella lusitana TaxID=254246 RepID=A0A370GJ52_9COXI|nr:hypothetical protein [Aquicella lusitana]RDI43390.1 hypothetical protein C8D86_11146 [Aquicella lusitana]VVC73540.1 hypothetical protein AQULUS_12830 [Aquicella lusitana]